MRTRCVRSGGVMPHEQRLYEKRSGVVRTMSTGNPSLAQARNIGAGPGIRGLRAERRPGTMMIQRSIRSAALIPIVLVCGVLVPQRAVARAAQAVLAVSPTSISVQASQGTNAASKSVQVSNAGKGALKWSVVQSSSSWLRVSPTSGTNTGTLTLAFSTSALAAGQYQTSFQVQSNAGSKTVTVQLSVASTVAKLTASCPANMTVASPDGAPVVVTYKVTTSGGVAPVTVTGNPPSGALFPVGTTSVQVTAKSSDNQTATCGFSVTVTYSTTALPTTRGPSPTITCPSGAVQVWPGDSIQNQVNAYAGTTTFCIRAGVHYLTAAVTPKTGNIFVGEYGAVLDGSRWSTTDTNQGAFRAHNQDIDDVKIRNLVIRNMPQRGIHAFHWASDRWTIEYNEITGNHTGVAVPNGSLIRQNYIHHNSRGGYLGYRSANTTFEGNEFAYNGGEQKVLGTTGITFRNNFVHHNVADGIWYDGENTSALIEGNRVEDNAREGIFYEISSKAIIRNNILRRNNFSGIFISTSKEVQVYGNTLEDNYRGIQYFLNCNAVGGGTIGFDLANNDTHDNTVKIGTRSGSLGNMLSYLSGCTSSQVAAYVGGAKNLVFRRNKYIVPSATTRYWMWGLSNFKYFNEWQSLGQDMDGTLSQ